MKLNNQYLIEYVLVDIDKCVKRWLRGITPRERRVIRLRFNNPPRTLAKCGDIMGVCTERVRQIESKAIRKLRHESRLINLIGIESPMGKYRRKYEGKINPVILNSVLNQNVGMMDLSSRASNCLKSKDLKIKTIGDLINKKREELMSVKNLGVKSLYEIEDRLKDMGLRLNQ